MLKHYQSVVWNMMRGCWSQMRIVDEILFKIGMEPCRHPSLFDYFDKMDRVVTGPFSPTSSGNNAAAVYCVYLHCFSYRITHFRSNDIEAFHVYSTNAHKSKFTVRTTPTQTLNNCTDWIDCIVNRARRDSKCVSRDNLWTFGTDSDASKAIHFDFEMWQSAVRMWIILMINFERRMPRN